MPRPGTDQYIIDLPVGGDTSGDTDRLFLLDPNGPATPALKTTPADANTQIAARLARFFDAGGRTAYVQGYGNSGGLPATPALAAALLPSGPGQVVAPELVAASDLKALHDAVWPQKVLLADGPGAAADSALTTLAAAAIASKADEGLRAAALAADTGVHKGLAAGSTVSVPTSLTIAGLIAACDRRNPVVIEDKTFYNCNVAAAGKNGVAPATMLGVADLRNGTRRTTLNAGQVNCFHQSPRYGLANYGFISLADTTKLPQWKGFNAARFMMAWRQIAAYVTEPIAFEQIDGNRQLLDDWAGALKAAAKALYDKKALYGRTPEEAYTVDTGDQINQRSDIQAGRVTAACRFKISPFVELAVINNYNRELVAAL